MFLRNICHRIIPLCFRKLTTLIIMVLSMETLQLNGEATLFLKYRETLSYALPPIFCMLIKSFHFVGNFRDFPN